MFQNFKQQSDPAQGPVRIAALREALGKLRLDGFIVPRADEHQGEYVPPGSERLAWLTGFTGSAGTAIILKERAVLFVDGRYTVQAREQVATDVIEPVLILKTTVERWLEENLTQGARLGYDPWLHTLGDEQRLKKACVKAGGEAVALSENPVDAIWEDRPAPPKAKVMPYPIQLAGKSSEDKRLEIGRILEKEGADAAVLSLPDSISWALNIRGDDVPHTPFPLSFALLHRDGHAQLFLDPAKGSPELDAHLGNRVTVRRREEFGDGLKELSGKRVRLDPASAPAWAAARLSEAGAEIVKGADPCLLPKACKNEAERQGARIAHERDGVAVTRFLAWFAHEAPKGKLDEISVAKQLETFRTETGALKDISFDTISGAGAHAALPHYRVNEQSNAPIEPNSIYLVDSGGQYLEGTTDITRTVIAGTPTDEMRDRFTRVLKGYIALSRARFPEGTRGIQLDTLARMALWDAGLDYDHGTGHGVGAYLSVHEGPQSISKKLIDVALKPGMILSNEPGYYKEGAFGIRIENLELVREPEIPPGGERPMLTFETLTLAPIDTNLIEPGLLTTEERNWLNAYHARVRETLTPKLDHETAAWLEQATQAV